MTSHPRCPMPSAVHSIFPVLSGLASSPQSGQHGRVFETPDDAARAWRTEGDESAARWLTEHLWPLLAHIALRHLPRGAAVEDLVQESLARAFTRIDQWNPARPFEPWVCTIATHLCLDALRHRKRRPEWSWSDLNDAEKSACRAAHSDSAVDPAVTSGGSALLGKLLDTLSPVDRVIITLLHLEQMEVLEISKLTGVSRVMVRVRAHRARHKLKKALEQLEATSLA